jgi:PIN domain nuclease of toxin-antitoxin system
MAEAARAEEPVYISPMSAWEIGMLSSRGRLALSVDPLVWFQRAVKVHGVELAEMTPRILVASSYLPGIPPRDPMDRIIAATARENDYRIITRDKFLLAYADEGHIKALAC